MRKRWDEILDRLPKDRPVVLVELGVWRGANLVHLVDAHPLLVIYGVDVWKAPDSHSAYTATGDRLAQAPQHEYDMALWNLKQRAAGYPGRVYLLRTDTVAASHLFLNESVDAVFVDADHSYEGCLRDIRAWAPKVKRGGWIGGHDIDHPEYPLWGVRRAVEEGLPSGHIQLGEDHTWFVTRSSPASTG